ncbi:NADP-dependent oxidoreductase [Flavobacterium sp. W20_MBD1_R3]|uniref:NADP-dependent oxidoreductase n=1 Tax=Flavobacterium sp. W20_MBD1_R3 TaxID=3240278 RepID=UPI003F93A3C9
MTTKQIVLAARPNGTPVLNDFRFENTELDTLQQGEVLLQGMYYSVDPYMRGRMNEGKSYVPEFELNKAIEGGVLATVLESKSDLFKTGDVVLGALPWSEKMIASDKNLQKVESTVESLTYYLGILGMTGLTAYFGLMHIGKPKAGETVVVSGAAGAVGITVGQIAKIQGARVIGIAGSDEKATMLKEEFGYDAVINYKTTTNINTAIANLCPNGVDVYFDNVGGIISDAVIQNLNFHARIALCGQISLYNSTEIPMGPRIQPMLLTRSVLMQGFIINNFQKEFPEGIAHLSKWVNEGKLKFTETIIEGFDQLPAALLGLFKGENKGKMIVKA